jgi:hypothetical protein
MMCTLLVSRSVVRAFVVPAFARQGVTTRLFSTSSLPEIDGMRAGEIKKELESYGINTKTFLEKSELVAALDKARSDGLTPKTSASSSSTSSSSSSSGTQSSPTTSEASHSSSDDPRPREERLHEEMATCKSMKAGELKKELEERGVSTKALFEKFELVEALAKARVDGVSKKGGSGSSSSSAEGYAEYADVEVLTSESAGPRKRSSEQEAAPQASPNPFGGMGGMPGGMGGIADMLKNMGGMGGASPFGGAANPFAGGAGGGDMMGKAQELMQNPRVRELMTKAQSNPRIMQILTECMSNPAALSKYEKDPEVSELIAELKKLM